MKIPQICIHKLFNNCNFYYKKDELNNCYNTIKYSIPEIIKYLIKLNYFNIANIKCDEINYWKVQLSILLSNAFCTIFSNKHYKKSEKIVNNVFNEMNVFDFNFLYDNYKYYIEYDKNSNYRKFNINDSHWFYNTAVLKTIIQLNKIKKLNEIKDINARYKSINNFVENEFKK